VIALTSVSRRRWAAIAAAVAVALGGGALTIVASAGSGAASAFVPIAPCRLIDTRATSPVGPRSSPILAGESLTVQVTGSNGSCVVPESATAIAINVTAVGPTAAGYITLYPADVALPNASNLNFTANQNPTPNLVTVSLSAGGAIKIFNESGAVNVLGDIAGYYQPDTGTENEGSMCNVGALSGIIVNGFDHENNVSSKCFTSLVGTLAGSGSTGYADGQGNQARFTSPNGVAVDSVGNIYVADSGNNAIRKITATGVVTIFAGDIAGAVGATNGQGSLARFNSPSSIAIDAADNLYVADSGNSQIRRITPTGLVSLFAGSPTADPGSANGPALSATFNLPEGVALDAAGNLYIADTGNHRIRKIAAGVVSTLAGSTQGYVDATGTAAGFFGPTSVAVDSVGNVYVADRSNHVVRKITPAGAVTTFAGSVSGTSDGVGGAARFNLPSGVAVDAADNVFVGDSGNHRLRKITPAAVVTTVAGSSSGYTDQIGTSAQFNQPVGLVVDGAGTIYVADRQNHRVRRIS